MTYRWPSEALGAALRRLAAQSRKAAAEVLPREAGLLARYVGSLTAPFDGYHPGQMTRADYLIGVRAIRADLLGRRRGQGIVRLASREAIERARDFYQALSRRVAVPMGWEGSRTVAEAEEFYDPDGTRLAEVHRRNRSRTTGRVTQANRLKQVGVWRIADQVFVTPAAFERYMLAMARRVGRGKKGWYVAGRKYLETGWPEWVKRAPGEAGGGRVDAARQERDPFIRLYNATHVARRADTQTAIRRGVQERTKRLVRSLDAELRKRVR